MQGRYCADPHCTEEGTESQGQQVAEPELITLECTHAQGRLLLLRGPVWGEVPRWREHLVLKPALFAVPRSPVSGAQALCG